ncbi:MAG: MEDS domain-containing protein [Gemmatimonadaceae bacterium]
MTATDRSDAFSRAALGGFPHICAFFNDLEEQHRVLRSFIKNGLDGGERALHIVDPELRQEHLTRLSEVGIDVETAMATRQLEIVPWGDAYLREGRFEQSAMLALIESMLNATAATGYSSTRLVANMEWALLDKPGVDDLVEYETRLNYVLRKFDDPVICAYDLSRFPANVVMDVMRTHPIVIIGGMLLRNPFFVAPDEYLLEIRERRSTGRPQTLAHDHDVYQRG